MKTFYFNTPKSDFRINCNFSKKLKGFNVFFLILNLNLKYKLFIFNHIIYFK